jgi:hypothetical protein
MSIERLNFRDALGDFAPGETLRAVLLLTYNLDGRWFEEVIAPELFDRVVDHCLLVRDGRAVRSELRSVRCMRANAGYSTRIFHPKLVLAVTEQRALACIGSANLTRGGYETNLELGTVFKVGPEGGPRQLFRDLLAYIREPLRRELGGETLATLEAIESALREALGHVPTRGDRGPHRLLHNHDKPLWDQLVPLLVGKIIKRVLIVSPFFEGDRDKDAFAAEEPPEGDDGSAIERLFRDLRFDPKVEHPVTVCFQENDGYTRLPVATIGRYAKKIELRPLDMTALGARPLHAKLLLIEGADTDQTDPFLYALSGSPNFTPAAFLRTPPDGNAEIAILTRLEGRRRTIDRVEALLGMVELFPRPVAPAALRMIERATPVLGSFKRMVSDATLRVGEMKVRVSLRGVPDGADRIRVLAFVDGSWSLVSEVALGPEPVVEFSLPAEFIEKNEGVPLALRSDAVRIEFYQRSELLHQEDVPLNVDCPDQFNGLHMVGPELSSLDARIAQAGAGVTLSYRDQAKWLERLRAGELKGTGLKVTRFQADLDQYFRHVHTGLRGHRERLKKNARSLFTVRRTMRDLSRWLGEVVSPDATLPSDECRMFLVERLAEETENVLRLASEQTALHAALPKAIADTALPAALDAAFGWVRALDARGAEEFRKQAVQALGNALDALNVVKG